MTLEPETVVDVELEADRGRIFFCLTQQLEPQKCSKKLSFFAAYFFSSKIFFAHLRQIQIKKKQSEIFLSGKEKRVRFFYFIFVLSRTRKKKKKKLIESCRRSFSVRNCSVGKISMSSISTSSLMSLSSSLSSPTTSNQRRLQLF